MDSAPKLRTMAGLEYHYLLRELSSLCGKFISKFYELEDGLFRLRFADADLLAQLGVRMHLTKYIFAAPQTPTNFCEFVRKRLEGKKLISLAQEGMDRIIYAKFSSPSDEITLVFEMFARGNLLVLDKEGTILRPYRKEEWKGRRLAKGEKYSPPPSANISFPPSAGELSSLFSQCEKEKFAISALSPLSIGTAYLNEALCACGIEQKAPASSLSSQQIASLAQEFSRMHSSLSPLAYKKDGAIFDFSVLPLSKYSSLEKAQCASLSSAADEYYFPAASVQKSPGPSQKKIAQLQERLRMQQEGIKAAAQKAQELMQAGSAIKKHAHELTQLSLEINSMRGRKMGWDEIAKELKKRKIEMEKSGSIIYLELEP